MRITESRLLEITTRGVAGAKAQIGHAGEQLSSGMRVRKPSDDPTSWIDGMRAKARKEITEAQGLALSRAQDRLSDSELQVREVMDILSLTRERSIMFANQTHDAQSRQLGAEEIRVVRERVLGLLNSQATDGEYLFAGSQTSTTPFTTQGVYQGDSSTRQVETSDGSRALMSVAGDEFTAQFGTDVLGTMDGFLNALATNDLPGIQSSITQLDLAFDQVNGILRRIGTRGAGIIDANDARQDLALQLDSVYSNRMAADSVAAAVELTQANGALEGSRAAIQQIVAMIRVN